MELNVEVKEILQRVQEIDKERLRLWEERQELVRQLPHQIEAS